MTRSPTPKGLRSVYVDDRSYLWRYRHRVGAEHCEETFVAFLEGNKRTPLRIIFSCTESSAGNFTTIGGGWGGAQGLIYVGNAQLNLNRPGVAAQIIGAARAKGWDPDRAELRIENGFRFLTNFGVVSKVPRDGGAKNSVSG